MPANRVLDAFSYNRRDAAESQSWFTGGYIGGYSGGYIRRTCKNRSASGVNYYYLTCLISNDERNTYGDRVRGYCHNRASFVL